MPPQLPDFLCIGTYKSASTWLHDMLVGHPGIFLPDSKEVHFFHATDGHDWYTERGLSDYQAIFAQAKPGAILGEVSPGYLHSEQALTRIAAHLPCVKLLVVLRDPADRLHSHYWFLRGKHKTWPAYSLDELIADPSTDPHQLLDAGFYARHIERWLKVYPRDQLKVLFFEDIRKKPDEVLRDVLEYIGADATWTPPDAASARNPARVLRSARLHGMTYRIANYLARHGLDRVRRAMHHTGLPALISRLNSEPRQNPPLTAEQRARIVEIYAADVLRLEEITGRDLSRWRKALPG